MLEHNPYDISVSHQPLQQVDSVCTLAEKYIRERRGDFSDSRLAGKLGSLGVNQLCIAPEGVSDIIVDDDSAATLFEVPEFGYGRQESRTGVRFGQLLIKRPHRDIAAEFVAVKYTTPRLAAREFAATRAIQSRLGVESAYEPIGFVAGERAKVGSVSRYRHEVTTIDRTLWSEDASREQRLSAAAFAGEWIATLHKHNIMHGDAQAKNIARSGADKPVFIDLEDAHNLQGQGDDAKVERQAGDISDFLRFLPERLHRHEFEAFMSTYIDTYQQRMVSAAHIREIYDEPLHPIARYAR